MQLNDTRYDALDGIGERLNQTEPMMIAHVIANMTPTVTEHPPAMLAGLALAISSKARVLHTLALDDPALVRRLLHKEPQYIPQIEAAVSMLKLSLPMLEEILAGCKTDG